MKNFKNYWLDVSVLHSREELGIAAGRDIEKKIIELLEIKPEIRMIFAAAPSQNETLDYLAGSKKIEWNRITAFNMDEYIGLHDNAPQLFSSYLNSRLFSKVKCKNVHFINSGAAVAGEIERFSGLISAAPIDIVCLGIGENGHIAFNDPSIADFRDPEIIKEVKLDLESRLQQVNEKCFSRLEDVPEMALTLTVPVLMNASYLFCMVPGKSKRNAVYNTLNLPVTEECPATILQQHSNCKFYFDLDSFQFQPTKQV